jgi:hypothetical protein
MPRERAMKSISSILALAEAIRTAEDLRLDPPDPPEADECTACIGTGQSINPDFPGEIFTCAECAGSGIGSEPDDWHSCSCPDDRCRC